jgi:hypothetical protein
LPTKGVTLFRYSEVHTKLLSSPYETNCKEYNLENIENDMRSDCIMKCINKQIIKEFGINCINPDFNYRLLREFNIKELRDYPICDNLSYISFNKSVWNQIMMNQRRPHPICEISCPKNCYEVHYDFEVIRKHSDTPPDQYGIMIMHNQHPDQTIEHRPIMTWIEMISSFGGILGMWLGLSFALILENIQQLFLSQKLPCSR